MSDNAYEMLLELNMPGPNKSSLVQYLTAQLYFPVLFFGFNGVGLVAIFTIQSPLTLALSIFVLIIVALLLSFTCERILPYQPDWNKNHGDLTRDTIHFVLNEAISLGPAFVVPIFVITSVDVNNGFWPTHWPVIFQVLLAVLLFDVVQNLVHWAAHTNTILWRLHAIHHEVQRMYGFNGIMKHPLYQIISGGLGTLPIALLGAPSELTMTIAYCSVIQLLIQHSNVDYHTGWMRNIIATAEVHRFHHFRGLAGNVNYALFFSFVDHLFGNAYDTPRKVRPNEIGLENPDYPNSWHAQMIAPFQSHLTQATGQSSSARTHKG